MSNLDIAMFYFRFGQYQQGGYFHLDPTGHWMAQDHITESSLVDSLGLLPVFAMNTIEDVNFESLKDGMFHWYGVQAGYASNMALDSDMKNDVAIDKDGVCQFGDPTAEDADPPQYPIMRIDYNGEEMYFYPHAFVACFDKAGTLTLYTRMD